jgi:hypothetical protein
MPKIFPEEQRIMIRELADQGKTNVEIAQIMSSRFPREWNAKNSNRTVARILKEFDAPARMSEFGVITKTLDEMTRDERARFIEQKMQATPRFRMAFRNFTEEDKNVFIDEYMGVIRSTDTLTEVEEQALFASILELVLAFQALNRKEKEEIWRDQTLNGEIPEDDPRYRRHVDEKYQREYDQHMKLYQKGMEQLKMSRKDRLKEVRSQKQTLVDLAEDLSSKNAQSEAADEIERLMKLKESELKRLLDLGHIHMIFEDF